MLHDAKSKRLLFFDFLIMLLILHPSFHAYTDLDKAIENFGQVIPNVYRGSRIGDEEERFQLLYALKVTKVINLEYMNTNDQQLCEEYGMECLQYPIKLWPMPNADKDFDYSMLEKVYQDAMLFLSQGHVIYIHCYHGSDRTGALASAIYLSQFLCGNKEVDKQVLTEELEEQLNTYGFHSGLYPSLKANILSWVNNPPEWLCDF